MTEQQHFKLEAIQLMTSLVVDEGLRQNGLMPNLVRATDMVREQFASFDMNEELIHEQFARHNRGEHLDLNINQEQALLLAWLDQRRYQQIAFIRQQAQMSEEAKQVALKYGFLTWADDDSRDVVWHQDKAEMQGWPIIQKIFKEVFSVGDALAEL